MDELNIGVAPYAKHKLKMWPEENMIRLLGLYPENHKCRFWLFGGVKKLRELDSTSDKDIRLDQTLPENLISMRSWLL